MLEIPEAIVIANQLNKSVKGKRVDNVIVGSSPHKFAFYLGNPEKYAQLLQGKVIHNAIGFGSWVEIQCAEVVMTFSEGTNILFHQAGRKRPPKHQLLLDFDDGTALTVSVQMYGAIGCTPVGENDNSYYHLNKERLGPLSPAFSLDYFRQLLTAEGMNKKSVKAFLATEQRIPGVGNGVLQDILFNAMLHPKRKIKDLHEDEIEQLYNSLKDTLKQMVDQGGRDTETDLYGEKGGYKTKMSKNTLAKPCPICHKSIQKANYMGGSIYFCSHCQKI